MTEENAQPPLTAKECKELWEWRMAQLKKLADIIVTVLALTLAIMALRD